MLGARNLQSGRCAQPLKAVRKHVGSSRHDVVEQLTKQGLALGVQRGQVLRAQASENGSPPAVADSALRRPVIVWFKHDLRTDDNPGLSRAMASGRPVIAFFCFDSDLLSDQATMLWGPEVVRGAVLNLRDRLKALDCTLVTRTGSTAAALLELVEASGADTVYAEDEVEERWRLAYQQARASLPPSVAFKAWRVPIWQSNSYVDNYRRFVKKRGPPQAALDVPVPNDGSSASGLSVDVGSIPDASAWAADVRAAARRPFVGVCDAHETVCLADYDYEQQKGEALRQLGDLVVGGEDAYLDLLAGYLRTPDGASAKPTWRRVQEVARQLENIPGNGKGSFAAIFQPALALGVLSRRRVYLEALQYETSRNGGLLPFGRFSTPMASAAATGAECGDYHAGLAHLLAPLPTQAEGVARRFWRWNGQITDYVVAEPSNGASDAPSVLLVHGFGACAEHWRRNVNDLAGRGYRVFACSLPGFGPSEKTPQLYTTAVWSAFVRDFVINVVKAPAFVAGNSIGGGIPAVSAANHRHLFRGVVLINTAGSIDGTPWDPSKVPVKTPPSKYFVEIVSRLVFSFLQRGIAKQLERLYPARPYNADKWLNDEIFRASCDPCALQVLQSGFYLATPTPLPHLLGVMYDGPVLVLQGVLDPLNDARGRAAALEERIAKARAVCIDAGHCPHDECPDLVNDAIAEFVDSIVGVPAAEPVLAASATQPAAAAGAPSVA